MIPGPNEFKARLADPGAAVAWGMFLALADPVAAEICAGAGFDLLVIDDEHGPNDAAHDPRPAPSGERLSRRGRGARRQW